MVSPFHRTILDGLLPRLDLDKIPFPSDALRRAIPLNSGFFVAASAGIFDTAGPNEDVAHLGVRLVDLCLNPRPRIPGDDAGLLGHSEPMIGGERHAYPPI